MSTDVVTKSTRPLGKFLAVGLIILSTVTGFGCSKEEPRSDLEYNQRAQDYLDKGELRGALIEVKNALQQNPQNAGARHLLGELYLRSGNADAARNELERALELGMPRPMLAKSLARTYLLQGEYKKLLEEIAPPDIAPGQDRAELLVIRGKAYKALEKPEQARLAWQEALTEQPTAAEAMLELGRLALLQREVTQAKDWGEQALAAAPEQADAWVFQGDYQLNQGAIQEAEAAYRKALQLEPNDFNARLGVATALLYQHKPDEVRKVLEAFKGIARNHPEVNYRLGVAAYQKGEYQVAQERFQDTIRVQPDHLRALLLSAAAHYGVGNLEQADTTVQQVLARNNNLLVARKLKAAIYLRRDQPQQASGLLKAALPQAAEDKQLLALLGEAAIKAGDMKTAVATVEKMAASAEQEGSVQMAKRTLAFLQEGDTDDALNTFRFAVEGETDALKAGVWEFQNYFRQQQYEQALQVARKLAEKFPEQTIPLNLEAAAHYAKGDIKAAQESLQKALAMRPNDLSTLLNLASLEIRQGRPEQARQYYLQVLEQPRGHLPALLRLAALDESLGQPEAARRWLERAIQENPTAAEPYVLLASAYLKKGQPQQALTVFKDSQQRFEDNPAVLDVIGRAQLAANEPGKAVVTLERLVKLAPNRATPHYLLGRAYAGLNNTQRFREELDKALTLEPNHLDSQLARARLSLEEDKPDQARQWIDKLRKSHPDHPQVLDLQGQLALQQQRPQEASKLFRQGLERFQTWGWANNLALAQWQASDREGSLATLEAWVQAHPGDIYMRHRLAMTYKLANRLDQAKAAFIQLLDRQPNDIAALNNLAWMLREKEPDNALQYAERAFAAAPERPAVMDTLAMVLLQKGQTERAVDLLRKAVAKESSDPAPIRFHLAQALVRNGNKDEARTLLQALTTEQALASEEREQAKALLVQLGK